MFGERGEMAQSDTALPLFCMTNRFGPSPAAQTQRKAYQSALSFLSFALLWRDAAPLDNEMEFTARKNGAVKSNGFLNSI